MAQNAFFQSRRSGAGPPKASNRFLSEAVAIPVDVASVFWSYTCFKDMAAVAGAAPSFPLPETSLPEFLCSSPFQRDSVWIREGPACTDGHFINGKIPEHKAAFVNAETGDFRLSGS
jgi:hypothetical protein